MPYYFDMCDTDRILYMRTGKPAERTGKTTKYYHVPESRITSINVQNKEKTLIAYIFMFIDHEDLYSNGKARILSRVYAESYQAANDILLTSSEVKYWLHDLDDEDGYFKKLKDVTAMDIWDAYITYFDRDPKGSSLTGCCVAITGCFVLLEVNAYSKWYQLINY